MSEAPRATGLYFDGLSARAHAITLRLTDRLVVDGGRKRVEWDLATLIAAEDMPPSRMRVSRPGDRARVEFSDAAFMVRLEACCPGLHRGRAIARGDRLRIALWSLAAGISILFLTIHGIPTLAAQLAPLIPDAVEARIGRAVDGEVVRRLEGPPRCETPEGNAALDRLLATLIREEDRLGRVRVSVRQHDQANAFALPGGRIVVLSGLIDAAQTPDEFAAVLAHELGHVAHRDPMRKLLAASGTSFLLGVILGDLTGSTVIAALGEAVITAGYSREAEDAADAFAVAMMRRAEADAAALATLLQRIDDAVDDGTVRGWLRGHPFTAMRAARIRALAGETPPGDSVLSSADWTALERMCGTRAFMFEFRGGRMVVPPGAPIRSAP